MSKAVIKSITIGEYLVNTYLVICSDTKQAVIIDPAGEEDRLARWVAEEGAVVKYILNTHGHPDHTLANRALSSMLGAPTAMHGDDVDFFASAEGRQVAGEQLGLAPPDPADIRLAHGDRLAVGGLEIEVIHTPGHSPGSVCFLVDGNLFTGDTLFVGAVGRTDLGGASLDALLLSLEERLLVLPDEVVVWPGHDYGDTPTSTLGREKKENPYITDFILAD